MDLAALLSSAHISVHLASDSLLACEVQRRCGVRRLARQASFSFQRGERSQAMQRLGHWIADAQAPRRTLGWVIGASEAQYFVLPWSPESVDRTLRDSYARARYEQLYESDARTAAFSFAAPAASGEQLVSCIPMALHAELQSHARASGCALSSIKPSLSAVWDRFRHVLESEQGTLCLVEGDQQAIVHHDRRRIQHVEVARGRAGPGLRDGSAGVLRRFSNTEAPSAAADLRLPRWHGSGDAQDSRYAFALCGAF